MPGLVKEGHAGRWALIVKLLDVGGKKQQQRNVGVMELQNGKATFNRPDRGQ
jgi:hypothetical protein